VVLWGTSPFIAGDLALFIDGQESVAKSHPEEWRYLCRFHPCNEILVRLYEIFKTGKKQDLTPLIFANSIENQLIMLFVSIINN